MKFYNLKEILLRKMGYLSRAQLFKVTQFNH